MACPVPIGDVQLIVHYAVEIYRKISNAEGEIKQTGVMTEELDDYLGWLRKLITSKAAAANPQDQHWNELIERLTLRMVKIKNASQGVYETVSYTHL